MSAQLSLPNPSYTSELIDTWRNKDFLLRLMTYIVSHDNGDAHCYAYNRSIAKKLGCSPDSVTRGVERLLGLGVVKVTEHTVGVLRRLAALASVADLRRLLWPRRKATPAQRARQRATAAHSRSAKTPGYSSFCPDVAEGSADTVAEGQVKENTTCSHREAPLGQGTDNRQEPGVGVQLDPAAVSALSAILPEGDALSIATEAAKSGWSLERVQGAIRAFMASSGVLVPGAWLRSALRAGNWLPPAPKSEHPSDRGEKKVEPKYAPKPKLSIPSDWVPGAGYDELRGCANEAVERLRAEGQWPQPTAIALQSPELTARLRDRVRLVWRELHPGRPAPWDSSSHFSLGRPSGPPKIARTVK